MNLTTAAQTFVPEIRAAADGIANRLKLHLERQANR